MPKVTAEIDRSTPPPPVAALRVPSVLPYALWAYLLLMILGFVVFRTRYAIPAGAEASMSVPRAVMTVANAATLTGFQTTLSIETFRPPAQWTLLILMLAGALLSWVIGGGLVARALRLPVRDRDLIIASVVMLAIAVVAGAGTARAGELFISIFRSISAVTNNGMWIGQPPAATEPATAWLYLPLIVIGGVGATVLVELWRWPSARRISPHAKLMLALTAAAYLLGVLLIAGGEWMSGRADDAAGLRTTLATASAESINARSAGLPIGWLRDFSRPAQWMIAPLMLAGGGPGGAAGGVHLTTVFVVIAGVARLLRGRTTGRLFAIAATWAAAYVLLVFATFILLLHHVPEMPADRLLTLAMSAFGNVGLSHDAISIPKYGAYVLTGAVVLGRVLPLLVLYWLTKIDDEDVNVAL